MKNTALSLIAFVTLAVSSVSGSFDSGKGLNRIYHARMGHSVNVDLHDSLSRRGAGKAGFCAQRAKASLSLSSSTSTTTTTSTTPEPTPTPTPTPTTTHHHHTTPSTTHHDAPAPTTPSGNSGGGGAEYTGGDLTFYTPGLNACGSTDGPNSMIAAVAHGLWDNYPGWNGNSNDHPLCNKPITVHWGGKECQVKITDRCGGCDNDSSLDLSPDAFQSLADPNLGRVHDCSWSLN